ncbi:MAG: hypothetical protein OEY22_08280 [Candidatus Bathyarchaeota archaeon]|nr:hypothetical protein [Candidatus Bathyarchaeota archaeon]
MVECPNCHSPMCLYKSGDWNEWICWNCGYYKSDTPSYEQNPELFINMVRENPAYFIQKHLVKKLSDDSYHEDSNRRKVTRTFKSKVY